MDAAAFSLFVLTALLVVIAPGPGMLYVISSGVVGGRQRGMIAALGTSTGILVHIMATALGLSALLQASTSAFQVLKWIGGGYLVYLAWQMWYGSRGIVNDSSLLIGSSRSTFFQGFLVNALNPKVAVFFVAFLPQFITPTDHHSSGVLAGLGAIFLFLTLIVFLLYGVLAGVIQSWLLSRPRLRKAIDRSTGSIFAYLGIRLLFIERP